MICLYQFEPGVGLGFSHAYFPTVMFDEYRISGAWAFAHVADGYVALCADGDLVLAENGCHAWQELRSYGLGQGWLCHMGRAVEDGSFSAFCGRLLRSAPRFEGASISWITPKNQTLSFDWEGPLRVDGQVWDLSNFPHYENLYTQTDLDADKMIIRHDDQELALALR